MFDLQRDASILFDQFTEINTARWSSTDDAATGTNALSTTIPHTLNVLTAAADNDYHLMSTVTKLYYPTSTRGCEVLARIKLAEANTDDSNWCLGLTDILTGGNMQADGAGPAATQDAAMFYKVDGTMSIKFETSNATAKTNTTVAAFTSDVWYQVRFNVNPLNSSAALVTPTVYNETTGVQTIGTEHRVLLASWGGMYLVFGVKAGAANAETLSIDYIQYSAAR
jgi:hypothetical protein